MSALRQQRDAEEERRERERFILLQHVYTLAEGHVEEVFSASHLQRDLGFGEREVVELVEGLVRHGYLVDRGVGPQVALTRAGRDYVERLRGRRRTVRLLH